MNATRKEFDFNGLREISGFGGTYEKACRKMVVAGVKWLRENPNADLKAKKVVGIYPDVIPYSDDFKKFQDAMVKACKDCTGAMVCACTKHALYIFKNGWEKYAEELSKKGRK